MQLVLTSKERLQYTDCCGTSEAPRFRVVAKNLQKHGSEAPQPFSGCQYPRTNRTKFGGTSLKKLQLVELFPSVSPDLAVC